MKNINFKLIIKRFTHWLAKIGSDADSDWKLVLSLSIIVFVVMILSSVQTFFVVQAQKKTGASAQATSAGSVDAKGLADTLGKYSTRAKEYTLLAATTTPFVDPSR